MAFARVANRTIEYEWFGDARRAGSIVLLHEGLGSVALWRDFPRRLAATTGRRVLAYSRQGYGRSDPLSGPRTVDFMHVEALEVLPRLLDRLGVVAPVLLGHSDGASIALVHAGAGIRPVRGVVVLAPHVFVEDVSLESIRRAKHAFETTDLRARLARYHDDPDSAFRGWNDIWLDPAFAVWNIEKFLPEIACPVLAVQGTDDEYGTMEQIDRIGRQCRDARLLKLERCGHSPHRDRPDTVLEAVREFVGGLDREVEPVRRGFVCGDPPDDHDGL
ncbi:MAG: alpha/beta fold hydrolase [Betaproteobacteria bacterium]|nr:alpha/beta fold hydrolase [Betaproteobacteria bacterium]